MGKLNDLRSEIEFRCCEIKEMHEMYVVWQGCGLEGNYIIEPVISNFTRELSDKEYEYICTLLEECNQMVYTLLRENLISHEDELWN